MKRWQYLLPLGIFVVLLGFLGVGLNLNPREVPSPLIGKPAPAFALPRMGDTATVIKRDDLLGKVWVLNVWASWCEPCREEHPLVMELARRKLAPVYGLNYKDTRPAGMAFLTQLGNPYEASLFDADGQAALDWGIYGAPETFVVDAEGIVRFKHIGPLTPDIVQDRIRPLLEDTP